MVSAPSTVPKTPIVLHGKPARPELENALETAAKLPLTAPTPAPMAMPCAQQITNALAAMILPTLAALTNSAPLAHPTNPLMNLDLVMLLNALLTTTPIAHQTFNNALPSVLAFLFHAPLQKMLQLSALRPWSVMLPTKFAQHAQLLQAPVASILPPTAPQEPTGAMIPELTADHATPVNAQLPPKTTTAPPSPNPATAPPFSAPIKLALTVQMPNADPCSAMPLPTCALHALPLLSAKTPPLEVTLHNTATPPLQAASLKLAQELALPPLLTLTVAPWSHRPAKTVLVPKPLDALLMPTALLALFAIQLPRTAINAHSPRTLTPVPLLAQTAPMESTATQPPPRPLVTTAQSQLVFLQDATCGKNATQPSLVLALQYHALLSETAPLTFAQKEPAPNAIQLKVQELNALLPVIPKNHGTPATPPLESAICKLMKVSPEVVSPESSLVPSCSSEPLSVSPSTAARRTANLTMPCKRPSSE